MSRYGGPLTYDRVLQALAALGTPVVIDNPTERDLPYLIGCLAASVDAAVHEHALDAAKFE